MKTALKILIATSFAYNLGAGMLGPIYAIFVEQIGGNILDAGMAWAIYAISVGISMYIFSRFEDKLPKKKVITIGFLMLTIGFASYYFVSEPIHLFMVQLYLGISMALLDPSWLAFFGTHVDKHKEAAEWGGWQAGKHIILGISAIIGSYIAFQFGFKTSRNSIRILYW